MKRKICMILCACFLMSCMVIPASAAEVSGFNFIDVLDYGGVNGGTAHSVTYSGTDVSFTLPYSMPIGYIDMVVAVSGVGINSCTLSIPSGAASVLSMVSIGNGLYRIYGFCNLSWASQITFTFGRATSGNSYITFHSIKLSSTHYLGYQDLAFFAVNGSPFQYMPGPGESVTYSWTGIQDKEHYEDYKGYIYLQNWKKYDVLDVTFQVDTNSFTAISANLDGVNIPMELSYFDLSSDSWYSTEVGESTTLFHSIPRNATVSARLDLSGVDRSSGSYVQIVFSGTYSNYSYDSSSFKLMDYWGFVELENEDGFLSYWLQAINTRLLNQTSSMRVWFQDLNNHLTTLFSDLGELLGSGFSDIVTAVTTWGTNINDRLTNQTASLKVWFQDLNTNLDTLLAAIDTRLLNQTNSLKVWFQDLNTNLDTLLSAIDTRLLNQTNSLKVWFQELRTDLDTLLTQVDTTVSTWGDALNTRLLNLTSSLKVWFQELRMDLDTLLTKVDTTISTWGSELNTRLINQTKTMEVWFQKIENAIRGDTAPGDAFQDEVDEKDQQLDDMVAVMDSVVRPDDIELSVDAYIDLGDVGEAAAPLTVLLTSELFFPIFVMSFILCTMGYLLYGKR